MLISVIIPAYNVEQYIHQCVDVVLAQTYENLEVILVDDGSQDETGKICDEYLKMDGRVKVIHQANGGLSAARNAGTEIASGDYLIYLDSDDKWGTLSFVENLVKCVKKETDMVLFTQSRFVDDHESISDADYCYCAKDFEGEGIEILERLFARQLFPTSAWSKMIRTSILRSNNIYFEPHLLGEDMDWGQKLLPKISTITFCNNACYLYRERTNSITTSYKLKNEADFCWTLEKWKNYWEQSIDKNKKIYLGYLAYLYVTLVYKYYLVPKNDRKEIRERVLKLSDLLKYSTTSKSKRLLFLRKILGPQGMLIIAGGIQYIRKK